MFSIKEVNGKIPVAITIAGSDSGGGAGIQADLKTFAALGVHGTTAITSITAQNTVSLTSVVDLNIAMIREQIKMVREDIGIDAGKTGMLHTEKIIKAVASEISTQRFPLVVDPVMISKSSTPLLEPGAISALKDLLLPEAMVVTPNKYEAEMLTGRSIDSLEDAKIVAREISEMGPQVVVIKGGHLNLPDAVDILHFKGKYKILKAQRLDVKNTHGVGCSFSAAIAAQLARGEGILSGIEYAKDFVKPAIKFGLNIGRGSGPVNPLAHMYREASRHQVLINVDEAREILESSPDVIRLVPEVGMNVAMAIPYAEVISDVAAISGRLVKVFSRIKALSPPRFGASNHLAKYILEIMKYDPKKRAGINIKFSEEILDLLKRRKLNILLYDRKDEPKEIKGIEGKSIQWGVNRALKRVGVNRIPDVIYHRGDVGKEPMIVILGREARKLTELVTEIAVEGVT